MNYDDLLELVEKRRTTRRYKPDPVPDEYIDKIIDVARWAPSGANLQPWDFVIVKDKKLKDTIVEICRAPSDMNRKMEAVREPWQGVARPLTPPIPLGSGGDYTTAPVFILVFSDSRLQIGLPMSLRYDYGRWQRIFTSGLANAFVYMHLAATTLGLGSQWVSSISTPYADCMLKNLLQIPEYMEIYDMMALGYPASKPGPRLMRDKAKMVHYDICGPDAFRTDEEIREYIKTPRA